MIAVGETLDGKYSILRRIGGGGFGEVYLAEDSPIRPTTDRIKMGREPWE